MPTERPALTGEGITPAEMAQQLVESASLDDAPDVAEPAPASNASTPEPDVAPAAQIPPADSPEARIASGMVTASDVETLAAQLGDKLDPSDYRQLRAIAEVQDVQRERQAAHRQQQLDRLAQRHPELSATADPTTKRERTAALTEYVRQFDYEPAELYAVNDARAIELAAHGLKLTERVRELEAQIARFTAGTAQPDDRETPARPTQPRRSRADRQQQQAQEAIARAAKSGRQRDAVDAIQALGLAD